MEGSESSQMQFIHTFLSVPENLSFSLTDVDPCRCKRVGIWAEGAALAHVSSSISASIALWCSWCVRQGEGFDRES